MPYIVPYLICHLSISAQLGMLSFGYPFIHFRFSGQLVSGYGLIQRLKGRRSRNLSELAVQGCLPLITTSYARGSGLVQWRHTV